MTKIEISKGERCWGTVWDGSPFYPTPHGKRLFPGKSDATTEKHSRRICPTFKWMIIYIVQDLREREIIKICR